MASDIGHVRDWLSAGKCGQNSPHRTFPAGELAMPVFCALDECTAAIVRICLLSEVGLENPAQQREALASIQACCQALEETHMDFPPLSPKRL